MSEIDEKEILGLDEIFETAIKKNDRPNLNRHGCENVRKLLRAELSRQKNVPLTCDGCKLSELAKYHPFQIVQCSECSRQNGRTDRYEPKGALE